MAMLPRPLKSHRQDYVDDCGRACAQMVIGYVQIGAGVAPPIQQDVLKGMEKNLELGWATDPLELVALINSHVSSDTWKLVKYSSIPNPKLQNPWLGPLLAEAATRALLEDVRQTIDGGFPAVVTTGLTDHWIVITGYESEASGTLTALYQADPLALSAIGATFRHSHADVCDVSGDIKLDLLPGDFFIVNAKPFVGQAVGIVTHDVPTEDEIRALKLAASRERMWSERWIVAPPIPPLMPQPAWPPLPWPWFVSREVSLRVAAHRWLPELRAVFSTLTHVDRGVVDVLDPLSAHLRFVRHERDVRPPFILVGAPIDNDAAMLIVLNQAARVQRIKLGASRAVVDALAADDPFTAEDLYCLLRFGELQPFVRRQAAAGRPVFERLGDGFRWPPPSERVE